MPQRSLVRHRRYPDQFKFYKKQGYTMVKCVYSKMIRNFQIYDGSQYLQYIHDFLMDPSFVINIWCWCYNYLELHVHVAKINVYLKCKLLLLLSLFIHFFHDTVFALYYRTFYNVIFIIINSSSSL